MDANTDIKHATLDQPIHGAAPLARIATPLEFTADQKKMIRDSLLSGASESEAAMLMELARLRRLNPITRQVHFVKRWDTDKNCYVWAAQVAIDGFRAIAERTGLYAGQDEAEFEYEADGKTIKLCRVRVYRSDWDRPAVGVAHFTEYAQYKKGNVELTHMWKTKPHVMIAKCAEAQAHRKAFSEDTSGLYTEEELPEEKEINPAPETAPGASKLESVAAKVAAKAAASKPAPKPASEQTVNAQPATPSEPIASFGPEGVKGKKLADLTIEQLKDLKQRAESALLKDPNASWAPKTRANLEQVDAELVERAIAAEEAAKKVAPQASAPTPRAEMPSDMGDDSPF